MHHIDYTPVTYRLTPRIYLIDTDLNLPLTAVAIGLVFCFLHLKAPESDFRTQIKRLDWT